MILTIDCRLSSTRKANAASDSAPPAAAYAPPSRAEIASVACGKDPTCELVVLPDSADLEQGHIAVVEHACVNLVSDGSRDSRARATWLLEGGHGALHRAQLLSERCAPIGMSTTTVLGPHRIRQIEPETTSDSGAPAASTVFDFALDPPRLLRRSHVSSSETSELREDTWDFEAERGAVCTRPSPDAPCSTTTLAFPVLTVAEAAFGDGSWRVVSLGECGVYIDGSPGNGVVEPAHEATGTVLRALLTDGAMYVEISDDAFVTAGKVVDRLNVTLTSRGALPGEAHRWQLFVDGRIKSVEGLAPQAEMVSVNPTLRRFKLTGASVAWRQSADLSYVDTADGITERAVLRSGTVAGEIHRVPADEAVCVPEGGSLRVRRKAVPAAPTVPLAP
jgi:hypothetical protein